MSRESQVQESPMLSETADSGDSGNGVAVSRRVSSAGVPAKPRRRQFSAEFKARIVEEAEACTQAGEIAALLRREGLYSSHLANWRRQYRSGAAQGLATRRGPKGKDPVVLEKEELERKVARLEHRLWQAEKIIEAQKNFRRYSGSRCPTAAIDEHRD